MINAFMTYLSVELTNAAFPLFLFLFASFIIDYIFFFLYALYPSISFDDIRIAVIARPRLSFTLFFFLLVCIPLGSLVFPFLK